MRYDRMVVLLLLGLLVILPFTVTADRNHTKQVTLIFPDRKRIVSTEADTIEEVLKNHELDRSNYRRVFPALDTRIKNNLSVFIYPDGKLETSQESKEVESTIRTIYSGALPEGRELTIRGSALNTDADYEAYEDTTAKIVLQGGRDYKVEQVDKLVAQGEMSMLATGYSDHPISTAPYDDGVSALGLPAGYGIVAVDPQVIPLGTRMYIEGYGYAIAADVGGGINGRHIDLCFDSHEDALRFGRKWLKVHILG